MNTEFEKALQEFAEHQAHYGQFDAAADDEAYCHNGDGCFDEVAKAHNQHLRTVLEGLKKDWWWDDEPGKSEKVIAMAVIEAEIAKLETNHE